MIMARRAVVACWFLLAAGCGGSGSNDLNTVGYSGPVSIRLDKFKDDEVRNGAFDVDKNLSTETGNPYGAFLNAARGALGRAPAAVLVDRVTLTLGSDTTGVTAFEQFMGSPMTLYLASSSATVNVGTVTQPMGPGPVEVTVTATRDTLAPIQAALTSGGGVKVGIRVPAAAALPRRFDAKVSVVLYFRALAV
jgi:hypothetical protein